MVFQATIRYEINVLDHSHLHWKAPAAALTLRGKAFVDGKCVDAAAAALFVQAGVPDGVFNAVPGHGHTAGRAQGLHMDCLAFTGATVIGRVFVQFSGQSNLKQVWPETSGKSPDIVFGDSHNLDAAADIAAFGIFFNRVAVCSAGSRLYAEGSIKDDLPFRSKSAERAAQ